MELSYEVTITAKANWENRSIELFSNKPIYAHKFSGYWEELRDYRDDILGTPTVLDNNSINMIRDNCQNLCNKYIERGDIIEKSFADEIISKDYIKLFPMAEG